MIETLESEVLRARGDTTKSLAFYQRAIRDFPQHRALIYDYSDLLLQNNQAETAVKLLAAQIVRHPSDTTLYDLQARGFAMLGRSLEQHQAQAYSLAWKGNLYAALEQLDLAKKAGGTFYQLSTVESDMRELKGMLDERGKK
jgi:predicted Zn-dependent protease